MLLGVQARSLYEVLLITHLYDTNVEFKHFFVALYGDPYVALSLSL